MQEAGAVVSPHLSTSGQNVEEAKLYWLSSVRGGAQRKVENALLRQRREHLAVNAIAVQGAL